MQLSGQEIAKEAGKKHPDLRKALETWMEVVELTDWDSHASMTESFPNKVKYVREHGGYVWNIKGNDYRILAKVDFVEHVVQILKVGTHEEYDYW